MERADIVEKNTHAKKQFESQIERLRNYSSETATEENNIFDFATKEFSQDAFIAWCLNWHNYPKHELYALANDFLNYILRGKLEIEKIKSLKVLRQKYKIDILVQIEAQSGRYAILIEDKTNTFEHDNQISKYIDTLVKNEKYERDNIVPVYFKTGFWMDDDYLVKCDVTIDGWNFYSILEKYEGFHFLVADFIAYLHTKFAAWKETMAHLDSNNYSNALKNHVGQYLLMRSWFEKWPEPSSTGTSDLYWAEPGTSYGLPWLEYTVWRQKYPGKYAADSEHMLFWRIDAHRKYLSLKHYSRNPTVSAALSNTVRDLAYQHFCKKIDQWIRDELDKQGVDTVVYSQIIKSTPSRIGTNERRVLDICFDGDLSLIRTITQMITHRLEGYQFPDGILEESEEK